MVRAPSSGYEPQKSNGTRLPLHVSEAVHYKESCMTHSRLGDSRTAARSSLRPHSLVVFLVAAHGKCQETGGQGKIPAVSQGCQIDRFTLKPSSVKLVPANYRQNAVRQGVKVPSPDVFALHGSRKGVVLWCTFSASPASFTAVR